MPFYMGLTLDLKVLKLVQMHYSISTVTLPQFRLRWLEDNDKKYQVRSLLHEQVRLVAQQQSAVGDAAVNLPDADGQGFDEEFFCFSSGMHH
jgi:hypothetical protein